MGPAIVTPMQHSGFPFMRLMKPDPGTPTATEQALRSIRHRIYFFLWNSTRGTPYHDDFVIDDEGMYRNVQVEDGDKKAMQDTSLLFANKKISAEFCEYIYSVSVVEVSVTVDKSPGDYTVGVPRQPWAERLMSRLAGPSSRPFRQYARWVNLNIIVECIIGKHRYRSVPIVDDVCDALDQWKVRDRGGRMKIKAYFSEVDSEDVTPADMLEAVLPLYRLYSSDSELELWFIDREPSAPELLDKFSQARVQTLSKWRQWAKVGRFSGEQEN